MNRELFDFLLPEEENREISIEKEKEKRKLYKEYEEAVKKFLEDGAETDKIREMEAAIVKYCNDYVDLLSMDEIVGFLLNELSNNVNGVQNDEKIHSIIEHAVFLGKISALYAMFVKKREEIRKNQEYRRNIGQIYGLRELLNGMTEDNTPFEHLCEISHVEEKNLNCILSKKQYFNVRSIAGQKLVSLAPEGKKLQKYLKCTEEKRYSQEEVENYIYMNSYRLINMFRQPKEYLPKSVTVIPLSDLRQNCLSFEFEHVYNTISSRQFIEGDLSNISKEMFPKNIGTGSYEVGTRRKENAGPNISKLRKFSRAYEKNFAGSRI